VSTPPIKKNSTDADSPHTGARRDSGLPLDIPPSTVELNEVDTVNRRNTQFGPKIGNYMGKPIFETINRPEGTYVFDRIAAYADDGYPLDQLSKNEMLIPEGLIYRHRP
jgi:hypothetical protein